MCSPACHTPNPPGVVRRDRHPTRLHHIEGRCQQKATCLCDGFRCRIDIVRSDERGPDVRRGGVLLRADPGDGVSIDVRQQIATGVLSTGSEVPAEESRVERRGSFDVIRTEVDPIGRSMRPGSRSGRHLCSFSTRTAHRCHKRRRGRASDIAQTAGLRLGSTFARERGRDRTPTAAPGPQESSRVVGRAGLEPAIVGL